MRFFVITAFPGILMAPLNESILKRARDKGIVSIAVFDLRDYAPDKHRQVDDYPYGGGPGMILKAEPFFAAVKSIKEAHSLVEPSIILMTPQGRPYDQKKARELSTRQDIILLCGHYKGIDERIREFLVTEEISIGDFILTGGELPALVIIDSVARLLQGAISDDDSAKTDSFENGILDCPHYTRPENFSGMRVPAVLLSGNHGRIKAWREAKSLERTKMRRADLISTINQTF